MIAIIIIINNILLIIFLIYTTLTNSVILLLLHLLVATITTHTHIISIKLLYNICSIFDCHIIWRALVIFIIIVTHGSIPLLLLDNFFKMLLK